MQASINRMNVEERGQWEAAYEKRYADFMKKRKLPGGYEKWKYQEYLKDYLRCIKSIDDEADVCWSIWEQNMI